jgi:hypothetical protein
VAREFLAVEKVIAGAAAVLAQLTLVAIFAASGPKAVRADISDEAAKPMAVAITPVPLLKLGGGKTAPGKLPKAWERAPKPPPDKDTPLPSPQAKQTPDAIPTSQVPDAAVAPPVPDAGPAGSDEDAGPSVSDAAGPPGPGDPEGVKNGTETDPLKARAVGLYRQQLAAWFAARFHIRGKVPFDELKTLHASAVVRVSGERRVFGYSVTSTSGNATFDAEVNATLSNAVSSGAELPAPPPMYPDILGETVPVGFQCTTRAQCE